MAKKIRDLSIKDLIGRLKPGELYLVSTVAIAIISTIFIAGYKYAEFKIDRTEPSKTTTTQSGKNNLSNVTNNIDSSENSMNVVLQGDSNVYNINSK